MLQPNHEIGYDAHFIARAGFIVSTNGLMGWL
jgi:hypothetical protein